MREAHLEREVQESHLTSDGNHEIQDKRLARVSEGTASNDAISKHQFETNIQQVRADTLMVDGSSHMTGDLDMRGKRIILLGGINMDQKLITNPSTDINQDLSAVNLRMMNSALALKSDKTYVGQIKADHENNIGLLDTGKLSNPTGVPLVMQN